MKIKYSKASIKFLNTQPKQVVERIKTAISKLTLNPPEGDIKPMQGYSDGRKRLRVGIWRIIFINTVENQIKILLVVSIGNRGNIYK